MREGALQETLPACSLILESAAESTRLSAVLNCSQSTRWALSPPTRESLVLRGLESRLFRRLNRKSQFPFGDCVPLRKATAYLRA